MCLQLRESLLMNIYIIQCFLNSIKITSPSQEIWLGEWYEMTLSNSMKIITRHICTICNTHRSCTLLAHMYMYIFVKYRMIIYLYKMSRYADILVVKNLKNLKAKQMLKWLESEFFCRIIKKYKLQPFKFKHIIFHFAAWRIKSWKLHFAFFFKARKKNSKANKWA